MNKRVMLSITAFLLLSVFASPMIYAHCEIPCGIYDDEMRYEMLEEHITTMEKAINKINELTAAGDKNYNQIVRWINNKEDHAQQFMEIVSFYFLNQRIKPTGMDDEKKYEMYITQLKLMHEMLVGAMKVKQNVDTEYTEKLKELVKESRKLYFKEHGHEH